MALDISDFALTTFGGHFVQCYSEADVFGLSGTRPPLIYSHEEGAEFHKFPKIACQEAVNRVDGTFLITDAMQASPTVENSVVIGLDTPIGWAQQVTYDQVCRYGNQVPRQYAIRAGRDMAEAAQNRLIAWAIKTAIGDTTGSLEAGVDVRDDNLGCILFDDTIDDIPAAILAIKQAIFAVVTRMDIDKVPKAGRYGAIHPTYFGLLKQAQAVVGFEYANRSNGDVTTPFDSLSLGGITWYSLTSFFNNNESGNTNMPTRYRGNFSDTTCGGGVWGVAWSDEALAMHESCRPKVMIDDIPLVSSWLIQARRTLQFGTLQPTGVVALVGNSTPNTGDSGGAN